MIGSGGGAVRRNRTELSLYNLRQTEMSLYSNASNNGQGMNVSYQSGLSGSVVGGSGSLAATTPVVTGNGAAGAAGGNGAGNGGNGSATNGGHNTAAAQSGQSSNIELNKDITMYRAVLRNELLGTSIDGLSQSHASLYAAGASNQSGVNLSTVPAAHHTTGAATNTQTNANVNANVNTNPNTATMAATTATTGANTVNATAATAPVQTAAGAAPAGNVNAIAGGSIISTAQNSHVIYTANGSAASLLNQLNHTTRFNSTILQPREMTSVFQYKTPFKLLDENRISSPSASYAHHSPYSLSPLSPYSQKLLRSPRKPIRKIPKVPFKVLDAPELQDDFYLNLGTFFTHFIQIHSFLSQKIPSMI